MTLRQSETMLRLLIGLALGFGFLGFATHGRTVQNLHSANLAPSLELQAHAAASDDTAY